MMAALDSSDSEGYNGRSIGSRVDLDVSRDQRGNKRQHLGILAATSEKNPVKLSLPSPS
jgi:hypothetical protein